MPSTYTNLLYHIVFSTKERRPFITARMQDELHPYVSRSQAGTVRKYIRNQEQHHRTTTFQQELVALLKRNEIEYDERYLWD
jgi:REP element-mobilizing transposase RayT